MDLPNGKVDKGSKVWEDKDNKISNFSEELEGATLFRSKYADIGTKIEIDSNKKAKVYIALSDSNTAQMTQKLTDGGWELNGTLYIEYKVDETAPNDIKTEKLKKVFYNEIKVENNVTLELTIVQFAILIKEGK